MSGEGERNEREREGVRRERRVREREGTREGVRGREREGGREGGEYERAGGPMSVHYV